MNEKIGVKYVVVLGVAMVCLAASVGCEGATCRRLTVDEAAALEKIKVVAIIPFIDGPGPDGCGKVVVNAAVAELYKCGSSISIVESSRLQAIMDERDFKLMSITDARVASKLGKRLGADVVILGEVMQYEAQQEYGHGAVHMFSAGGTKHIHRVGLSVRAVNVKDSRVIYAESGEGASDKGYPPAVRAAVHQALGPWPRHFKEQNAAKKIQ